MSITAEEMRQKGRSILDAALAGEWEIVRSETIARDEMARGFPFDLARNDIPAFLNEMEAQSTEIERLVRGRMEVIDESRISMHRSHKALNKYLDIANPRQKARRR